MFRNYIFMLIYLVLSSSVFGMGADHKNGDLPPNDGWLPGTYEAVNLQSRVHGYWINSSDTLFYKAENAVLERMIENLTAIEGLTVRVVLHPGKGDAKSPWSKKSVDSADWTVSIAGKEAVSQEQNRVTIDVWLGGNLTLDELDIPPTIEVESGKEIETYIKNRIPECKVISED